MHVWWQWKTVHKKRWFTSYEKKYDTQSYCYLKLPEGIPISAWDRSYGSILRRQRGFGLRSARGQMQPGSGNCWAFGKPTSSLALGQPFLANRTWQEEIRFLWKMSGDSQVKGVYNGSWCSFFHQTFSWGQKLDALPSSVGTLSWHTSGISIPKGK